jgi:hypothetical protein
MRRRIISVPGPTAENKDWAREQRENVVLPALRRTRPVVLDFATVTIATQSFVHACISKAVAEFGEDCLDLLEFRSCNPRLRAVIESVIEYSLRARLLTKQGLSSRFGKKDVPQADSLPLVRDVVDALAAGDTTPGDVAVTTGFSLRHVHYRLHAARVLGLAKVVRNLASLTPRGIDLSRVPKGMEDERKAFEAAILASPIMKAIAPDLLGPREPELSKLTQRLERKTGLSPATARRRASALISWRRSLLQRHLL